MSTKNSPRNSIFERLRQTRIIRQDSQWVGGVSAGIAQRFNIDVVLVRGIFVALTLLGGAGLPIYGLAWGLLPDAKGKIHLEQAIYEKEWPTGLTGALTMVIIGIFPAQWFLNWAAPVLWPTVIIAAILFVLFSRKNTKFAGTRKPREKSQKTPSAPAQPASQSTSSPVSTVEIPWRSPESDSLRDSSARTDAQPPTEDTSSVVPEAPTVPLSGLPGDDFAHAPKSSTFESSNPLPQEDPVSFEPNTSEYDPHNFYNGLDPKFDQDYRGNKKTRIAPALPGWVATTVVGVTILVIALVLVSDYLEMTQLPGNGWAVALASGLFVVGLSIVFAALSRRTSGGLLGLAIPLLVLTVIFGGTNFRNTAGEIVHSATGSSEYSTVFSNSSIDLTDMGNITGPTTVNIDSVFSKVNVKLPWNVPVKIETDGIFNSGVNGKLPQDSIDFPVDRPVLTVKIDGVFSSLNTTVSEIDEPATPAPAF